MSFTGSRDIDIEASPSAVLDVIADVESLPSWSSSHKKVSVLDRTEDGRPRRIAMTVSLMGITDDQVIEYSWTDSGVTWDLVESTQQKSQHAEYRLTETDSGTHLEFEMTVDLKIPVPGFLVKRGTKSVLDTATEGLRQQVVG